MAPIASIVKTPHSIRSRAETQPPDHAVSKRGNRPDMVLTEHPVRTVKIVKQQASSDAYLLSTITARISAG